MISPTWRKPKKEIEHAAYNMTVSLSTLPAIVLYMPKRVSTNIRWRGFFGGLHPIVCLAPYIFNMSFSCGQDDSDLGLYGSRYQPILCKEGNKVS